tara:strand:+ start:1048 stop:1380 length:333 start_codon:yes stop_codon:yes gene_type:complete
VNVENGVIAASIPKIKLQHFVMKEGAYGELAFLKPAPQTSEKAVSSKRLPARQPAAPPKDDARERALEEQRLRWSGNAWNWRSRSWRFSARHSFSNNSSSAQRASTTSSP